MSHMRGYQYLRIVYYELTNLYSVILSSGEGQCHNLSLARDLKHWKSLIESQGITRHMFLLQPPFYSRNTTEMYKKILHQPLEFKSNVITLKAKNILEQVCSKALTILLRSSMLSLLSFHRPARVDDYFARPLVETIWYHVKEELLHTKYRKKKNRHSIWWMKMDLSHLHKNERNKHVNN